MYIRHNLQGLKLMNESNKQIKNVNKANERLASGLRINRAADDAAGLSISEGMRAQIRALARATQNAKEAESLVLTTDGVLGEITDTIQRMRELSVQALSDTLTDQDRQSIQKEFSHLQEAINEMVGDSNWNTKPVIEQHSPAYAQLEGNRIFPEPIKIVDGYNNDLEIVVDGFPKKITIPEGIYDVNEIADAIDNELIRFTPPIIVDVTENQTLSLQTEEVSSIDSIKGGAAFLFYEYTIGNPPGMIIGTTNFQDGQKLTILPGKNDKLSFYAGASKQYTITFPPQSFSKEELIDYINQDLASKGEDNVKAIPYGTNNIAITSDKYVITGLSGNMIEIDGITSIIYDIAKQGSVSKSSAYYYGRANLTTGVTIKRGENDRLRLQANDDPSYYTINLLKDGEDEVTLTGAEVKNRLEEAFSDLDIDIRVSLSAGRLNLNSNLYGSISKIQVDSTSSAHDVLFNQNNVHYYNLDIYPGTTTTAKVEGNYGLTDNTTIDQTNNKLVVTIDNTKYTVNLGQKTYTKDELIAELNNQFATAGMKITASFNQGSNGKSSLVLTHKEQGQGSIYVGRTAENTAYDTLFGGTEILQPYFTGGTTGAPQYPPEGEIGDVIIPTTPATAQGRVDLLSGMTITDDNHTFTFTLNGNPTAITLANGNYNAQGFIDEVNRHLDQSVVTASLKDGRYLLLSTKAEGSGQAFQAASGPGLERESLNISNSLSGSGGKTSSSVTGRYEIPSNFTIDGTNDELLFTYSENGVNYDIAVRVTHGDFAGIQDLLTELNEQLSNAFQAKGIPDNQVIASASGRSIKLTTKNSGNYQLSSFSGDFFREAMQRYDYVSPGYGVSQGSSYKTDSYIVGRETIVDKEIIINPNVNDRLTFDLYKNGAKATFDLSLPPGKYNATEIVSQLNNQLKEALTDKGFPNDTLLFQIGGIDSGTNVDDNGKLVLKYHFVEDGRNDTGTYRIDGVRGSAAYTIFYRAQGEPAPSYTVGIVDLSQGTKIKEGVNDTFVVSVDGVQKTMILPPGEYVADDLLGMLNSQLKSSGSGLIASYYEGRLKLSSEEFGQISIDSIQGNARGTLFFEMAERKEDPDPKIQVGANAGQAMTLDKTRLSLNLLRINTVMVHTRQHAEKALVRLDEALQKTVSERSKMGAYQNRLSSIINGNEQYHENIIGAESRIRDANMANEVMNKAKSEMLLQVSQTLFSQASHQPQTVLELLK
ncbi:flagellin N-terminal helical domain-containing protein [Robertmurraya andreesenii]|uniref:Flagellin n=1 Tax=Anoxybacillus andreesenii TaxID=1325932 RepID=A0ABT9V827_9BACL|nr:flagellin [Robertmurraya andreesenii]MDQ0157096.1 flagellin-like hook-associated protein FlgL [Robertmurraya andreesenii]